MRLGVLDSLINNALRIAVCKGQRLGHNPLVTTTLGALIHLSTLNLLYGKLHTMSTIMIGEKIADMIRGQEALPRSTARYFVANGMPVRVKK